MSDGNASPAHGAGLASCSPHTQQMGGLSNEILNLQHLVLVHFHVSFNTAQSPAVVLSIKEGEETSSLHLRAFQYLQSQPLPSRASTPISFFSL